MATRGAAKESDGKPLWSEGIRVIGGLVAVGFGVTAVVGIAVGAFIVGTQTAATIAGSTAGVVGSIVGAYFGVKVGTDQTKTALENAQQESAKKDQHAAKAQVYALHVSPANALAVEEQAQAAAQVIQA
jgi:hypothetical protein